MASFTYTGVAQPILLALPITVGATTFAGGSGTLTITVTPGITAIDANVGSKSYNNAIGDSSLVIAFTASGDYLVTLSAPGFKAQNIYVRVNP